MRLRALTAATAAMLLTVSAAPVMAQGAPDTLTVTRLSDYKTCFHPICFQNGNQYMNLQLVFNSLVKVDADEATLIPDLADSWEVSADAKSFTFKLNPGAKWHDGTPVTADDVIYTAATAAQMADTYTTNGSYSIANWLAVDGAADVLGTADIPAGLVKVDDHTVTFNLAAPNAVWLRSVVDPAYMIMPKHIFESMDAAAIMASDAVNGIGTIGSGPYKLINTVPDVSLEYEANADYHKGAPNIPRVIFPLNAASATAAAQLQTGELDMVFDLTPSDFDVLSGTEGINVVRVPGIGVQFLQYPVTNPAVADVRVRQAIYHGFDRKTLLETVFQGAGQLLWAPLAFDAEDPALNRYEFDPEKAKALLAEAQADGFDPATPLRIIYIAGEPGWDDIAAAVENDLRNIGLNPVLEPSDGPGWTAKLPLVDQYEISLQCCGSFFHPDRTSTMFNAKTPIATMYANQEMDDLFAAARETGDPAEQAALYAQIALILNTDVPYNWLWAVANTHANNTAVGGFEYYPNARETFAQIEDWTLTR